MGKCLEDAGGGAVHSLTNTVYIRWPRLIAHNFNMVGHGAQKRYREQGW